MRNLRILAAAILVAAASAPPAGAARHASSSPPTVRQLRAAVRDAERSSRLWATINICNSRRFPHVLGIRGQMPGLSFATRLRMTIGVDYWDSAHGARFRPLPGLAERFDGGPLRGGSWQAGVRLKFNPQTGLVRGRITFQWLYRSRAIGQLEAVTSAGHRDARYGDPGGFSADQCTLP